MNLLVRNVKFNLVHQYIIYILLNIFQQHDFLLLFFHFSSSHIICVCVCDWLDRRLISLYLNEANTCWLNQSSNTNSMLSNNCILLCWFSQKLSYLILLACDEEISFLIFIYPMHPDIFRSVSVFPCPVSIS